MPVVCESITFSKNKYNRCDLNYFLYYFEFLSKSLYEGNCKSSNICKYLLSVDKTNTVEGSNVER